MSSPVSPSSPKSHAKQVVAVSGKQFCSHCSEALGLGAAIVIESLGLYYHVQCFRCCVCHSTLGYGVQGADVRIMANKLHCRNCYSNDEAGLIFSEVSPSSPKSQAKQVVAVSGKQFCSYCSEALAGLIFSEVSPSKKKSQAKQVVAVSGKQFCSYCSEALGLGAAIVIESLGLYYHVQCFRCCVCHSTLGYGVQGADVRIMANKSHCRNCYSNDEAGLIFSEVSPSSPKSQAKQVVAVSGKQFCSYCSEALGLGAAMVIASLGLYYHVQYFRCCVCHSTLGKGVQGADVRIMANKLHCRNCYSNDEAGLKFSKV
ncbi:LMO7 [Mytilus coruscus]|uniref:LMO7 n=1 Tax=Mytilus coruscus TaxID=42192 RepID=A0A6J7ZV31_MYTCO|nr:LMO7 [Mytilus coruscus]